MIKSIFGMLAIRLAGVGIGFINVFLLLYFKEPRDVTLYQSTLSFVVFVSSIIVFGNETEIVRCYKKGCEDSANSIRNNLTLVSFLSLPLSVIATYYYFSEVLMSLIVSVFLLFSVFFINEASLNKAMGDFYKFQLIRSLPINFSMLIVVVFLCVFSGIGFNFSLFFGIVFLTFIFLYNKHNFSTLKLKIYSIRELKTINYSYLFNKERALLVIVSSASLFLMTIDILVVGRMFPESEEYVLASRFSQLLMVIFVIVNSYYMSKFNSCYKVDDLIGLKSLFKENLFISLCSSVFVSLLLFVIGYFLSDFLLPHEKVDSFISILLYLLMGYGVNLGLGSNVSLLIMCNKLNLVFINSIIGISVFIFYNFLITTNAVDLAKSIFLSFLVMKILMFISCIVLLRKSNDGLY